MEDGLKYEYDDDDEWAGAPSAIGKCHSCGVDLREIVYTSIDGRLVYRCKCGEALSPANEVSLNARLCRTRSDDGPTLIAWDTVRWETI